MADALVFYNPPMAVRKRDPSESPSKHVQLCVWKSNGSSSSGHSRRSLSPCSLNDTHRSKSLDTLEDEAGVAPEKSSNRRKSLTPSPSLARKRRKLSFDSNLFNLVQTSPELLAAEITLIDLPLFRDIPRAELLEGRWTSKQKTHVSPNIVAFTQQFNQISFWVMKEILDHPMLKRRVEALSYFIRLAKKLLDLNNINSLVAIVSALQSAPIFRLKRTWADLARKEKTTYQRLQTLLSEEDNRKALRHHMEHMKLPCIPYLGVFLTDLTYLTSAKAKVSKDSCDGDFTAKMLAITDQIAKWQMSVYPGLESMKPVLDYLVSVQYLHEFTKFMEDNLFRTSVNIEPDVAPQSTCSLPPSPTASRRLTLPSSMSVQMASPNVRQERKSIGTMQPSLLVGRGQSVPTALGGDSAGSRSMTGTPTAPYPSSHVSMKLLGHRRAHSFDHKLVRDGMKGLSVMDTEAKPGPRHLIDDSLIPGTGSTSSSTGDSGICKLSPIRPSVCVEPVVGIDVHVHGADSDSGAESENLLEDSNSSDCEGDSPPVELSVDLLDATMTGMLKRKSYRRKHSLPRVQRWKQSYMAICGLMLAFYAKGPKRQKGRAVPFQVFDLADCLVADNVLLDRPCKFQLLHKKSSKVYLFKAPTPEEAEEWLKQLHSAMKPLMPEKAPELLMTFEEEGGGTMSGSLSSAEC
eukprot:scpid25592/ scgid22933/ Ras-specific guanine nucleotide-releasing factor RalGPS2; Ral GEF with PH domain and SH3-binding motif 2; RalA exchange factor RalGPS2